MPTNLFDKKNNSKYELICTESNESEKNKMIQIEKIY